MRYLWPNQQLEAKLNLSFSLDYAARTQKIFLLFVRQRSNDENSRNMDFGKYKGCQPMQIT